MRKQQVTSSTPLLWSTQLYDALGWPPLGYDAARERHLEQQYYKAIHDEHLYRTEQRRRKRGTVCK